MRFISLSRPLAILALAALAACERPSRSAEVAPVVARGAPATSAPAGIDSLAASLGAVTDGVDTLVTYRAWMASHPGEVPADSVIGAPLQDFVCRAVAAPVQIGGRTFTRTVLFGHPEPPAGEALPDSASVVSGCPLRSVWLVARDSSSDRIAAFADTLSRALDVALGTSAPGLPMYGLGTRDWERPLTWHAPTATVAAGYVSATRERRDENTGRITDATPGRVIVVAFAPNSGWGSDDIRVGAIDDEDDGEREMLLGYVDSALAVVGDARLADHLTPALDWLRNGAAGHRHHQRPAEVDSALVRAARLVSAAAPTLDAPRRAAALGAVDMAVALAAGATDDSSATDRRTLRGGLEAAGFHYVYDQLGAVHVYSRNVLREAVRLDSLGGGGRLALVALLGNGWVTGYGCDTEGAAGFDQVIAHGEAALKAGATDPLIHYYVGIAHADIVALADDPNPDYHDPAEFRPRAAAARARAIAHLRAALAGLTDRRLRRHAWRLATALMAGRSMGTRFYCVYD